MLGIRESRTPSIRLIFHKIEREREEFYLNFIRFNLRLVKVVISLLTVQEQQEPERKKYKKGIHLKQKQNKELLLRWSI